VPHSCVIPKSSLSIRERDHEPSHANRYARAFAIRELAGALRPVLVHARLGQGRLIRAGAFLLTIPASPWALALRWHLWHGTASEGWGLGPKRLATHPHFFDGMPGSWRPKYFAAPPSRPRIGVPKNPLALRSKNPSNIRHQKPRFGRTTNLPWATTVSSPKQGSVG
jgi:hypothetical protein